MFTDKDRQKCAELYEHYYSGRKFHDSWYRDAIHRHLPKNCRLLDAGCGRYLRFSRELQGTASVVGIDMERQLETKNARAPYGVCGDVGRLPFSSGSFDMIICRSVVEHLAEPEHVFQEFARVLRPGGKVVILTPNKYDYISLAAALTPYRVHRWLVSRIFRIPDDDVYPTLYRANTGRALRRTMKRAGLQETDIQFINHYPAYLMFSPILFRLGVAYERLTALSLFRFLRGSILCVFEKRSIVEA